MCFIAFGELVLRNDDEWKKLDWSWQSMDGANGYDMKLTEPTLKAIAIERPNVMDQHPPNM